MKTNSKRNKKRKPDCCELTAAGNDQPCDILHNEQFGGHCTPNAPSPINHLHHFNHHHQCHSHRHLTKPIRQCNLVPHQLTHYSSSAVHLPNSYKASSVQCVDDDALCCHSCTKLSLESPFNLSDKMSENTNTTSVPKQRKSRLSFSHCHRARHRVWQSILMITLVICAQMTTVFAMLDALKALFILTGASTYLGKFCSVHSI